LIGRFEKLAGSRREKRNDEKYLRFHLCSHYLWAGRFCRTVKAEGKIGRIHFPAV
jgi:hypothetical protein